MSTLTQFAGAGIKSIQRGVINIAATATSATATITAVDTAKTVVINNGCSVSDVTLASTAYVNLTNATTLTATRQPSNGTTTTGYTVIEYN